MTVERHVSNVLRKVGARNRTELASRLQQGQVWFVAVLSFVRNMQDLTRPCRVDGIAGSRLRPT